MTTEKSGDIPIGDIEKGDFVLTHKGFKRVLQVYKEKQPVYKIKLKDGKEIKVSSNHIFPTLNKGLMSIENGLTKGDFLFVKKK